MTFKPSILERVLIRFSVMPSLKYSLSGSLVRFLRGRTATERIGGGWDPVMAGCRRELTRMTVPMAMARKIRAKAVIVGCRLSAGDKLKAGAGASLTVGLSSNAVSS